MDEKHLRLIQNALWSAMEAIRITCGDQCNPDDKEIDDTFYKMNHCWLHIQDVLEKEGD